MKSGTDWAPAGGQYLVEHLAGSVDHASYCHPRGGSSVCPARQTTPSAIISREMIVATYSYQLTPLDELWVELTMNCGDALTELVRVGRKKYAVDPVVAHLGVPSKAMVAYLVCVGRAGLSITDFAEQLKRNTELKTSLTTMERELNDAVQGSRNFQVTWFEFVGKAARMSSEVVDQLVNSGVSAYPTGEPYLRAYLEMTAVAAALEERAVIEAAHGGVVLTTISAVAAYVEADPEDGSGEAQASLSGVIVGDPKRWQTGITMELTDGLDTIQLVARKDSPCYAEVAGLVDSDRITTCGSIGRSSRGRVSVFMDSLRKEIGGDILFAPKELLSGLRSRGLPPRFTLGRAVQLLDEVLTNKGYLRYESSLISSALRAPHTVESLEVYFTGWGAMTNLVPTAIPQLIRVGIGLGVPRVYASSRVITRAIRDGYTSPDSPAAALFALNLGVDEAISEIGDILSSSVTRLLDEASLSPTGKSKKMTRSNEIGHELLNKRKNVERGFEITPFRSIYPAGHILAEGHVAHVSESLEYLVATIHTERMLQLLLSHYEFRRVAFHGPENLIHLPGDLP